MKIELFKECGKIWNIFICEGNIKNPKFKSLYFCNIPELCIEETGIYQAYDYDDNVSIPNINQYENNTENRN